MINNLHYPNIIIVVSWCTIKVIHNFKSIRYFVMISLILFTFDYMACKILNFKLVNILIIFYLLQIFILELGSSGSCCPFKYQTYLMSKTLPISLTASHFVCLDQIHILAIFSPGWNKPRVYLERRAWCPKPPNITPCIRGGPNDLHIPSYSMFKPAPRESQRLLFFDSGKKTRLRKVLPRL